MNEMPRRGPWCRGAGVAFLSQSGGAAVTGQNFMEPFNQSTCENSQSQRSPCFVCGQLALAERMQTAAFRLCPACARLLRWLRTRLSEDSELRFSSISLDTSFTNDLRLDS